MALKTCLIDLGNVLLFFSHPRMISQLAEVAGKSPNEVRGLLFEQGLGWEFEKGRITQIEFHERFEAFAGRPLEQHAVVHAAANIFEPNLPMLGMLKELKRVGLRLVLLSNTNISHLEFIQHNYPAFLAPFDHKIVSFEVGEMKPHPLIFQAALAQIDCEPDECLYTDDIEEYVRAGRTHGLHAEVFTTAENYHEHLQRRGVPL